MILLWPLVNSCNLDSLDFNKLSTETNLSPEIVAPFAKANVSVWDLIQSANNNNPGTVTKGSNGLINIVYQQNDLYKYNVRDFVQFPTRQDFSSENKALGNISIGDINVSRNITLNDLATSLNGSLSSVVSLNGMNVPFPAVSFNGPEVKYNLSSISDYQSITLSSGTMAIILNNQLKVPVKISGSLFDVVNNRKITDFTFATVNPNGTSTTSVSLAGLQLSNQIEFRMMTFETPGSSTPVNINLNDYFKVTFNLTNLGISAGTLTVGAQTLAGYSGTFGFTFPEPDLKAFGASLKNGLLSIRVTNTSQLTGNINFTLPGIKRNGAIVSSSIPLNGTTTTIDLSGADINFAADPAQPYNRIPYTYSLQVNKSSGYINYSSTNYLKMEITLTNLDFKSIQGDFGKRQIQIDNGQFAMNVDFLNKLAGSFKLANPSLNLIIRNSIGMQATVSMNFTGSNKDGQTAALNPPAFDIPVPANLSAGVATKSVLINRQNSNIVNFVALPPTGQISYSGKADFNATTPVTQQNPNFLDVDATFAIDLAMTLPLELQTSNLEFRDTASVTKGDYDKVQSAELTINAKNGIPLNVDLQLFFIDTISKVQFGQSVKTTILTAAQVDAQGNITPVQSSKTFTLDATEMDNLRKANGIVFSGTISSPSGGTGTASILSDSKIELNAVIKSKVKL